MRMVNFNHNGVDYVNFDVEDPDTLSYLKDGLGFTSEETDALCNAPQSVTTEQRVSQLERGSVETILGLAEVYETSTDALAVREQETVDTMLGLAEAYEVILMQQATIDALTARVAALEGSES